MSAQHAAAAWLRQERQRLRPELMLRAFATDRAARGPAAELRDIAADLDVRVQEGAFGLCFDQDRQDMAALPAALSALANRIDGRLAP